MADEIINQAIEDHLGLWWTDSVTEAIQRDVGPEGLVRIQEICAFAETPGHWISAPSHDAAYLEVQDLLKEKYAFLSHAAIGRIATAAAYSWK